MAYVKKGTPLGRPKVYLDETQHPVKITTCVPRELYAKLEMCATRQQTSLTGTVVRALDQYLSDHLRTIDDALTVAAKVLGHLEAAISPDHPLMPHVNALYESLTPIADVLATLHPEETAS